MQHDKRTGTSGSITRLGCLHARGYISLSISCVLNVCHLSLEPTPSFGAIFTLGRVINACDALNLGCPESTSARQSGTQNPLRLFPFFFCLLAPEAQTVFYLLDFFFFFWLFFWWSPLNKYLLPLKNSHVVSFEFINFLCVFACLCTAGCLSWQRMKIQYFLLFSDIYEIWK